MPTAPCLACPSALRDPLGHLWVVSTRLEDVQPAEMERRFQELMAHPRAADRERP